MAPLRLGLRQVQGFSVVNCFDQSLLSALLCYSAAQSINVLMFVILLVLKSRFFSNLELKFESLKVVVLEIVNLMNFHKLALETFEIISLNCDDERHCLFARQRSPRQTRPSLFDPRSTCVLCERVLLRDTKRNRL